MSMDDVKYDRQKLAVLIELRDSANKSQSFVAEFFGVRRDAVSRWESGRSAPRPGKRSRFIVYLLDILLLRDNKDKFQDVWDDVMYGEWKWRRLSRNELGETPRDKPKEHTNPTPNTIRSDSVAGKNAAVPFLAPKPLPYGLVGCDKLLSDLKERLFARGTAPVIALRGMPGVGKTALALTLAHDQEVKEYFQDGVLWVGLGPHGDVLSGLDTWAMALGISSFEMEKLTSVEEKKDAIHQAIGTRRMLLMVDGVWQADAANHFTLTGPNCASIVTTRRLDVSLEIAGEPLTVSTLPVELLQKKQRLLG